jgi:NAD(P)-dependent dehydrogenase (short-subunit alcohol dehydrogenase family)
LLQCRAWARIQEWGPYSPSKAALISLCQVLAQEWAVDGINVNTVSPGMIRTPLTHKVYENNQIAKDRAALIPLGRIGEPEDIANAIGFLISPEAEYMTGQNLLIDGGFVDSLYRSYSRASKKYHLKLVVRFLEPVILGLKGSWEVAEPLNLSP